MNMVLTMNGEIYSQSGHVTGCSEELRKCSFPDEQKKMYGALKAIRNDAMEVLD
jgi:hypothetical protein